MALAGCEQASPPRPAGVGQLRREPVGQLAQRGGTLLGTRLANASLGQLLPQQRQLEIWGIPGTVLLIIRGRLPFRYPDQLAGVPCGLPLDRTALDPSPDSPGTNAHPTCRIGDRKPRTIPGRSRYLFLCHPRMVSWSSLDGQGWPRE